MPWRNINTTNSVIRGGSLKGHKPPFWSSVNLSDTFKTQVKQDKQSFCVTISGEKKMAPNLLFLRWCIWSSIWCIWCIWYEFQLKYWRLCFGFCKIEVSDSVSRDLWYHQNWHISCCNHWNFREKKFLNSASVLFIMKIKEVF